MDTDVRKLSPEERQRLANARFTEFLAITRWLIVGFAFLILLLWTFDWSFDPDRAPYTLWLRTFAAAATLATIPLINTRIGIREAGIIIYTVILGIQVIYTQILALLHNGFVIGIGGYLYFFLATVLLGQAFSFRLNAAGCVLITAAPNLFAPFITPAFPHLVYMALIWPAGIIAILFHWSASGLILDRLYYRRKMENLSMEDPLTGLLNRRALLDDYLKARSLAARENEELGLIILDVDHFKHINDTYGHPAGDRVLRELADIMKKTCRASDSLARIGGEEFVCLLPDTNLEQTLVAGERLRQAVERARIPAGDRPRDGNLGFTISLGATRALPTETFDDLLARADEALYRAKESGRNRLEHNL